MPATSSESGLGASSCGNATYHSPLPLGRVVSISPEGRGGGEEDGRRRSPRRKRRRRRSSSSSSTCTHTHAPRHRRKTSAQQHLTIQRGSGRTRRLSAGGRRCARVLGSRAAAGAPACLAPPLAAPSPLLLHVCSRRPAPPRLCLAVRLPRRLPCACRLLRLSDPAPPMALWEEC